MEVTINQEAVEPDRRFNGKFVLMINTELPAAEVAQTYKGLWRVERTSRREKLTLDVLPIYHHRYPTTIDHIVASFLGLRLEVDLQARKDKEQIQTSRPDLMRDLHQLQAVRIILEGQSYLIRTDFEGDANHSLKAARVQPPSRVTRI